MKSKLASSLMKYVPRNHVSYAVGRLVHVGLPEPMATASVKWFAKTYNINLNEAELPIESYKTIGQLFTRRLKAGLRPVTGDLVHPADSKIAECGKLDQGRIIQAKGKDYTASQLLRSPELASQFEDGFFLTYYLCPTDYHRVHSPVTGKIKAVHHIPGSLWPVNAWGVENIDALFAVNERLVFEYETDKGPVAVVMVGATNVGRMTVSFDPTISTNQLKERPSHKSYRPAVAIKAGDEIGIFHMGSTVVVLYPKSVVPELPAKLRGAAVRFGEALL